MNEFKLIITPDEEEPEAGEVYVDGAIGGKPYRFLFDTGAARSSVVYDEYTATFEQTDKHDSSGVFAKHSEDVITVPSLEVGPISKQNVTITRYEKGTAHVRTLIGMDLLKEFRCHFLFNENRVVVGDDIESSDEQPKQDLFLDKGFHPYINVQFGAVTAKAVWDTGASITIADETFIKQNASLFREGGHSEGIDSTGAKVQTPMYILAESMIGGTQFPPIRVASVDLSYVNSTIEVPMNLIVGYNTMSKANWLFDFPRKQWAISKRLMG